MKKLLYLIPYSIIPTDSGGKKRIINNLRVLSRLFEVQVVGFSGNKNEENVLKSFAKSVTLIEPNKLTNFSKLLFLSKNTPVTLSEFYSPILEKVIKNILAKDNIDILWANEIFLAQYFPINFKGLKVLDRQKIDSLYIKDVLKELYPGKIKRSLKRFDLKNLKDYERNIIDKCDICFLPADQDIANLTSEERKKYKVLPNSINLNKYTFIPYNERKKLNGISIFANWEYPPNTQGLKWFLKEISDLTLPDHLILNVEGKGSEELKFKVRSGINIRGYAKEITQIYNNARAMIVPLNTGGGTRLKIMEALASGVPVLSTKIGAESLGLNPKKHYLEFESGIDFFKKLNFLQKYPKRVAGMVTQSRKFVEKKYSELAIETVIKDNLFPSKNY